MTNATANKIDYTTCVDCAVELDAELQQEFAAILHAQTWVLCAACYNARKNRCDACGGSGAFCC
jgi:hypothetical protein